FRKRRKKNTLVDANVAHAELTCPFYERYSNVGAVKFEADAFRTPLRVALPGLDWVAIDRILHELERGHLRAGIRNYQGVEEQPIGASHLIDENANAICFFERKWIVLGQFGHEREHSQIGVAVHEYMLDVFVGGKAGDRILLAAMALGVAGKSLCPILASRAAPSAGRVD